MKTFLKIFLILWLLWLCIWTENVDAGVDFSKTTITDIQKASISTTGTSWWTSMTWNVVADSISNFGFKILKTIKIVFWWFFIVMLVYAGIQMIMSMGTNEDDLSKSKRSLWYSFIWVIFINIPWTLYDAFNVKNKGTIDGRIGYSSFTRTPQSSDSNIFIDVFSFWLTLNQYIIWFIEVWLGWFAVAMIVIAGVKIMSARGREENVKEGKEKIIWSLLWMLFLWFIEVWKYLVFSGNVSDGANLFATLSNLALFFAGPIAIFFLTLAGYYYITSGWEDDKIKKAKSIVTNTVIATVILLASYTFLLDLATL